MTEKAIAEISTEDPSRIDVQCAYRDKDKVKSVPGARWNPTDRVWTTPLSWTACLALRAEFGADLAIGDELRAWATPIGQHKNELLAMRPLIDDIDIDTSAPGMADLYPHQKVDALAISIAKRYMLMNGTGTGKTRSALAGMSLAGAENVFPAMIAAPLSMLRTWEEEIEGFFPEADVSVVVGTPAKAKKALEPGHDIYIISWDSLRRHSRLASYGSTKMAAGENEDKAIQALDLKTFIGDEVHRTKNPKSKRTRAAWKASEGCEYVIGLTGTPMQDTPEDLYGILHLLHPEEYSTKTGFMDRFVEYEWNVWGGRDVKGILKAREDEWEANFNTRTRRMTKEMVLDFLPPKIEVERTVSLPAKHRKAYETLKETYMVELETSTMAVANQLVLAGRLVQMANALGDLDEEGRFVMLEDKSPKVDAFMADLKDGDYDGEQIVVFSDSRQLIDVCAAALRKAKIKYVEITGDVTGDNRKAAMDAFQAGEFQVCLLTRAGGEGITLTAASTMVRLTRPWSFTTQTQVEDRIHRIGSEIHESVRYVDYVTEDTIEEDQILRLKAKGERIEGVLHDGELLALLKGDS